MELKEAAHARFEVTKVQSSHTSFRVMDEKHCPDRALEPICIENARRYQSVHRTLSLSLLGVTLAPCRHPRSKDAERQSSPRPPSLGPGEHVSDAWPTAAGPS